MMLQLYKSVVRPHVEFAISSWSPHFKKDIEKIQHRFTRLLQRMKHLSYEDRLIKLNLTTLERRRERGDIIQTYKIMHGLSDVNINELFTIVEDDSITRRHSKKCTSNTLVWIAVNTSTVNVLLHHGTNCRKRL